MFFFWNTRQASSARICDIKSPYKASSSRIHRIAEYYYPSFPPSLIVKQMSIHIASIVASYHCHHWRICPVTYISLNVLGGRTSRCPLAYTSIFNCTSSPLLPHPCHHRRPLAAQSSSFYHFYTSKQTDYADQVGRFFLTGRVSQSLEKSQLSKLTKVER